MQGYPMGSVPPGAGGAQGGQWGQQQQWQGQPGQQQWGQQQWQGQPQAAGGQWQGVGYGRPPPPPSDHYGNYGQQFSQNVFQVNAWQALQMNSPDELRSLFASKQSPQSQGIQAEELCQIMNQSEKIKSYYRITWSLELCKIMVAMLDRSKDGFMQYPEFEELLQCLTFWYTTFCQYDHDRSGFIEAHELGRVVKEKYGYSLSVKALEYILKRYSKVMPSGQVLIALDDFISLSVRLRAYTEAFRARDRQEHANTETGHTNFSYDDFIQVVMCL